MKKGMNKKSMFKAALAVFALGFCMVCPRIPASASGTSADTLSAGNIIYEDKTGAAAIYTADIALLKETLRGVRAETYDPASYGHVHQWEYTDITERAHTERCLQCSPSVELVKAHTEISSEKCMIAYDGKDYPGYRYLCECGFEWLRERYHTPVYTPIDASFHAVTCALHGTAYCGGMGEIEAEHISMLHPTDESHHRPVCEYCKYEGAEQACIFNIEGSLDENGITQVCRRCECGNQMIASEELPESPKTEETPGLAENETETGEETPAPPENETEIGEETPNPPENETEIREETPAPPENEADIGKEIPEPSENDSEEGAPENTEAKNSLLPPQQIESLHKIKGGNQ